jgi:hypothetical protein
MAKQKSPITVLKEELMKLIYQFTVQASVTAALIAVLNQDNPDLKERIVAVLENTRAGSLVGQAMVDEAIEYVRTIH